MISIDFTNKLKERFPKINDGVINDILEELEKYDDYSIKTIWDTFNRSYGPTCRQWGTGYNGQECYDCLCRKCCGKAKGE